MTTTDDAKTLDNFVSPGTTVMVGFGPEATEFRPLTVARVRGSEIEILLDTSEPWARSLDHVEPAVVTLSDDRHNNWATLTGVATTTTDSAIIDELWNPAAAAYFDQGRATPGITVLRIDVEEGRYWSTPSGRLGALISMVKAKLGSPEDSGEHGPIAI